MQILKIFSIAFASLFIALTGGLADERDRADQLMGRGDAFLASGDYRQANEAFLDAAALFSAAGDSANEGIAAKRFRLSACKLELDALMKRGSSCRADALREACAEFPEFVNRLNERFGVRTPDLLNYPDCPGGRPKSPRTLYEEALGRALRDQKR